MLDIVIWGSIVIGLTEVVKRVTSINSKFIPLLALIITFSILGIFALVSGVTPTWEVVQEGFIVALTSVGLFSSVKTTLK